MGKMKRPRTKLHTASAKVPNQSNEGEMDVDLSASTSTADPVKISKAMSVCSRRTGGVFSKININMDQLMRQLNQDVKPGDEDTRSMVTSKSLKGLGLKKKDKRHLRHDLWMNKMSMLETHRKEEKERQKREKTAVVGDMRPLQDTLPTLDLLFHGQPSNHKSFNHREGSANKRKERGVETEKFQRKQMMDNVSTFHAVLDHPDYKSNPLNTILQHLSNKQELEQQQQQQQNKINK